MNGTVARDIFVKLDETVMMMPCAALRGYNSTTLSSIVSTVAAGHLFMKYETIQCERKMPMSVWLTLHANAFMHLLMMMTEN